MENETVQNQLMSPGSISPIEKYTALNKRYVNKLFTFFIFLKLVTDRHLKKNEISTAPTQTDTVINVNKQKKKNWEIISAHEVPKQGIYSGLE